MRTYILEYNKPNILTFHGAAGLDTKTNEVKDKKFIPGINKVSDQEYKELSKNPLFKKLFDDDRATWIEGNSPDDDIDDKDFNLVALTEKKALAIVKKTLDKNMLDEWSAIETRDKVIAAIQGQLKKLKLPEPKKQN